MTYSLHDTYIGIFLWRTGCRRHYAFIRRCFL